MKEEKLLNKLLKTFTPKERKALGYMFEGYQGEGLIFKTMNTKSRGITNSISNQALRILVITDVIKKAGHGRDGTVVSVLKPLIIKRLIEEEHQE